MKVYNSREVHKYLRKNGWLVVRVSGDHFIYLNDGVKMSVPKEVNRMLLQRLNKQYHLGMF